MIDPRMPAEQLRLVRECVDDAGMDRGRLQFCVYSSAEARMLLRWFPESVLLWKIGLPFSEVQDSSLDEAGALDMDGVMLIWPLHDEDFSEFMNKLRARKLRCLFYLHGAWPKRSRPDNTAISFNKMVREGVDYLTTTASHLPKFREIVVFKKKSQLYSINIHFK